MVKGYNVFRENVIHFHLIVDNSSHIFSTQLIIHRHFTALTLPEQVQQGTIDTILTARSMGPGTLSWLICQIIRIE